MSDFQLTHVSEKKFFQISEVSKLVGIKAHTLRFWEKEFEGLNPETRKGNRRYYTKQDIELVFKIKSLLYENKLTVAGAKVALNAKNNTIDHSEDNKILEDLEEVLKILK
tara:strand:+ start:1261 stop:1590 length:330 start_codon:yes stop_codon:yes gene_type:complete